MFLVLLDIILLLIIIQFAYIKIAFEMYGQYHLPHGKNPALSCLIGFVSMDRAKQQNYSTIQYKWQFTGSSCRLLLGHKSGALAFINILVPFADMWDIKLPGPLAKPEYSAKQPGWSTQSWRRHSNEQWGVKSQSCTFPAVKLVGRSNNSKKISWRDEATIISLVAESASPSSSST